MNSNYKIWIPVISIIFIAIPLVVIIVKSYNVSPVNEPPQQINNINLQIDSLLELSAKYINNNTPEKSIPILEKVINSNPSSAVAYNNLGVAYIMLKKFEKGKQACEKALQIDPNFELAKNNLKWAIDEIRKIEK